MRHRGHNRSPPKIDTTTRIVIEVVVFGQGLRSPPATSSSQVWAPPPARTDALPGL